MRHWSRNWSWYFGSYGIEIVSVVPSGSVHSHIMHSGRM